MQAYTGFELNPGRLEIDSLSIPLNIRKGKRGKLRIGFEQGKVWIETPSGQLNERGTVFLKEKSRWIKRNFLIQQRRNAAQEYLLNHAAHETRLFGKPTPVRFETGPELYFRYNDEQLNITLTPEHANRRARCTVAVLKKLAVHYLERRVAYWAQVCKLEVNDLRIKSHRSKWGSCSTRRNINLNWYLILADKPLIDYVIVHELMHLREMNHGERFWAHVAEVMPDYQDRIAQLRQQEWVIGAYLPLEA
jgi:predicted metal-dependent hydrolase